MSARDPGMSAVAHHVQGRTTRNTNDIALCAQVGMGTQQERLPRQIVNQ